MLRRSPKSAPIPQQATLAAPADLSSIDLAPIADHPRVREINRELDDILRRIAQAENRERRARERGRARRTGATPNNPAILSALLSGGKIDSASPEDEIAASHEEQRILHIARLKAIGRKNEIIAELSVEANTTLIEFNKSIQLSILQAIEHLSACYAKNYELRNKLLAAGYLCCDHVLPSFALGCAHMAGDPAFSGGEAHRLRRFLTERGLVEESQND